jgi:NAD(P)-dependent dehydrogenase (short-subunit alcohol dehydrogenase family)
MNDFNDKVIFVTGSARRVGREIALEFARNGANVVIHYASPDSASAAQSAAKEAEALGVKTLVIGGNQANSADVSNMINQIRGHFGRLDVVVNSAAIFKRTDFLDISEAEWDLVMGINLKGPFMLTQHTARLMIESGNEGVIINISDNSGLNPWQSRPHHSISKAGVIMLTQVAALALARHKIRVNCVVPGPVLRPAGEPEAVLDGIAAALPIGHIGNPKNIAQACLFLARNDFATGTILRVDGGEGIAGGQT